MFREVIYARDVASAITRPHLLPGDTLFAALRHTADYALAVAMDPLSVGLIPAGNHARSAELLDRHLPYVRAKSASAQVGNSWPEKFSK